MSMFTKQLSEQGQMNELILLTRTFMLAAISMHSDWMAHWGCHPLLLD